MIAALLGEIAAGDLRAAQEEVQALPEDAWIPHYNTADYEGRWHVAALRSLGGDPRRTYADPTRQDYEDTPLLDLCPTLSALLSSLQCTLLAARLMRLGHDSMIFEHSDHNLGLDDGEVRLHLCLDADDGVRFVVDRVELPMRLGQWWYADFNRTHSVTNDGDRPRVNLVVDAVVDDRLGDRIRAGAPWPPGG